MSNIHKNVDILVQARMGSTRLPNKVLLPFFGTTILEFLLHSLARSKKAGRVIVATTTSEKDNAIEEVCRKGNHLFFRGSEEDCLGRFYEAGKQFGSDVIVRVTSDNPFTDVEEADRLIAALEEKDLDYVRNVKNMPLGTVAEAFNFSAFERVHAEAADPYEHEHITPYFYRHPEAFKQEDILPLTSYPMDIRLTLDTDKDYQVLKKIEEHFEGDGLSISLSDIAKFLASHPEVVAMNQDVIQKTDKA